MATISLEDPAVQSYIVYSAVLGMKMFAVAFLTGKVRTTKKVFANEEDAKASKGKVKLDDPDVERVRRAHLNDLENIPAFWVLGALYLTTGPSASLATTLFRLFTAGRIIYTIVYAVKPLPPPARGIAFGVPLLINMYMGFKVIQTFASAL
ncbi:microsomal glutathione S-transferase 1-like [Trichoplusia ni]|uniref:Microsomal glutathione S-transferase 1 n=1 Tax=Trichoplusia ni TaxID=7111 RepID=A0A7E5VGD3_TRINI|nr:microsomal glutathione S-transferase 1-like [Trichoplusia ni]